MGCLAAGLFGCLTEGYRDEYGEHMDAYGGCTNQCGGFRVQMHMEGIYGCIRRAHGRTQKVLVHRYTHVHKQIWGYLRRVYGSIRTYMEAYRGYTDVLGGYMHVFQDGVRIYVWGWLQ